MIIVGLDVSMSESGIAIYDTEKDEFLEVLSIPTNKVYTKHKKEHKWETEFHGFRLKHIYDILIEIKEKYNIDYIISERGFSRFNKATQVVYKVHGVASLAFYDIPSIYYPTKTIKETVTSSGTATKFAVKEFIVDRYPHLKDKINNDNESDACACVLTYVIKNNKNYKYIDYDIVLERIIKEEEKMKYELAKK